MLSNTTLGIIPELIPGGKLVKAAKAAAQAAGAKAAEQTIVGNLPEGMQFEGSAVVNADGTGCIWTFVVWDEGSTATFTVTSSAYNAWAIGAGWSGKIMGVEFESVQNIKDIILTTAYGNLP